MSNRNSNSKKRQIQEIAQAPAEVEECSICAEPLNGNGPITTLPCEHKFHERCINQWTSGPLEANNRCPECRAVIDRNRQREIEEQQREEQQEQDNESSDNDEGDDDEYEDDDVRDQRIFNTALTTMGAREETPELFTQLLPEMTEQQLLAIVQAEGFIEFTHDLQEVREYVERLVAELDTMLDYNWPESNVLRQLYQNIDRVAELNRARAEYGGSKKRRTAKKHRQYRQRKNASLRKKSARYTNRKRRTSKKRQASRRRGRTSRK